MEREREREGKKGWSVSVAEACRPLRARASQTMPDIFIAIRDGRYINTTGFPLRVWTSAASVRSRACAAVYSLRMRECTTACLNARNAHARPRVQTYTPSHEIGEKLLKHCCGKEHKCQKVNFFFFFFKRKKD